MFNNYLRSPRKKCLTIHFLKTLVRSNLNNKKRNKFLSNYYSILLHSIVHKLTPDSWTKREDSRAHWARLAYSHIDEDSAAFVSLDSSRTSNISLSLPYLPLVDFSLTWARVESFFLPDLDLTLYSTSPAFMHTYLPDTDLKEIRDTAVTLHTAWNSQILGTQKRGATVSFSSPKKKQGSALRRPLRMGSKRSRALRGLISKLPIKGPFLCLSQTAQLLNNTLLGALPCKIYNREGLEEGGKGVFFWDYFDHKLTVIKSLINMASKSWAESVNIPSAEGHENSIYLKIRHLGYIYSTNQLPLFFVKGATPLPHFLNGTQHFRLLRIAYPKSGPKVFDILTATKLLDPFFRHNPSKALPLLRPATRYSLGWARGDEKRRRARFTFFNRFWLYIAPSLNDLIFKFFNSRFKYFMFLMARYEKTFRLHFHIQTITRLNQYFLSFFLTKNISFKNHKKIINSNILVAYIKPNKRIYTSLKFLKLFITFKKKEFFSSKVYFLIKFALLNDKSFINSYVSRLYLHFNRNLSNKIIKSPEAGHTIKVDIASFSSFVEGRKAEPITEAVAAALLMRKEYIQKVRKLKRERLQMKALRKN